MAASTTLLQFLLMVVAGWLHRQRATVIERNHQGLSNALITPRQVVQLKPPSEQLFADSAPVSGRANYLRFRLSPNSAVALAARVKRAGADFVGEQRELYLVDEWPGEQTPYEPLLGDAMAGNGALFTREDAVEAAWAVVDPVLIKHRRTFSYKRGGWGPKQADALIAADGGWYNPRLADATSD